MAFCSVCHGWRAKLASRFISSSIFRINKRCVSTADCHLNNGESIKSSNQFSLSFEEYQKLRRKVRTQKRISGIPFAAVGLTASSMVSVMFNPHLFDATDPEQIQPIL